MQNHRTLGDFHIFPSATGRATSVFLLSGHQFRDFSSFTTQVPEGDPTELISPHGAIP